MAKSENQKLKMLYLLKILSEETDESHFLSTQQLIDKLEQEGILAERKSIYSDISCLNEFGYHIEKNPSRLNGGYYMLDRKFELPELKLLVDVVTASKFITQKKSKELIHKLEGLGCSFDAKQLQRQVYVANRIKSQNESIYDNIDTIHRAMAEQNQIEFGYASWTIDKELKLRRGGRKYCISPWALTISDENYYMVGFDSDSNKMKHYRVDKMSDMRILSQKREGRDVFEHFDIAQYSGKVFGMYGGEEKTLTLQFPNTLIGVVIDRFGKDISVRKREEDSFSVRVEVAVSNQLYGWLAGMGPGVRILLPEEESEAYRNYLLALADAMKK